MEIDNNTYIYIIVLVILIIISLIISSSMSSSSGAKVKVKEKKTEVKSISQSDIEDLPNIDMKLINQSGGISGKSSNTNTSSGPKEFKTKSSNVAELIDQ